MPTFDTPEPISARIDVVAGDVRLTAGDRAATVVDVRPSDASNEEDVKAARATRVEYAHRELLVRTPRSRSWLSRDRAASVDVTIELPAGSGLHASGAKTDFRADGRLGDVRIQTGLGHIRLDEVGTVSVKSGIGDVALERATGHVDITSGSGELRLRELAATAAVKNSNGDTWIGEAHRDLRIRAANGDIAVDRAHATVAAKSANGDVRVGEAMRGSVVLESQIGDLEVGIREGTAAWLDVRAAAGKVHNALEATEAPDGSAATVEVRARTTAGDVVVRRPQAVR
jgi:DUF4097 and DUF4098 domain-containing protein YvlB